MGLSASIDSELNKHPTDYQLELDLVVSEMDQMQITKSGISLRAREIPKVDQSEISLRVREILLIDRSATAAINGVERGPKFDDSDDHYSQDSPEMYFVERTKNPIFLDLQSKFQMKSPANQLLTRETASTGHSVTRLCSPRLRPLILLDLHTGVHTAISMKLVILHWLVRVGLWWASIMTVCGPITTLTLSLRTVSSSTQSGMRMIHLAPTFALR